MKKILALFLSLLLLGSLLSACGQREETAWDPVWVDYFKLSDDDQETFRGLLEEVDVTAEVGDLTLTVGQTVSDLRHLYVPLTIQLPEEVQLSDYDVQQEDASLSLGGLTLDRVLPDGQEVFPSSFRSGSSGQTCTAQTDEEANTISFLLGFYSDSFLFSEVDLTLSFQTLQLDSLEEGQAPIVLAEGDYSLTWFTGKHEDTVEQAILDEDGNEIGAVILSPLGLFAHCSRDNGPQDPLHPLATLYGTDGQALPGLSGYGGSSSDTQWEGHWFLRTPTDPSAVGAVEIAPYRVEF